MRSSGENPRIRKAIQGLPSREKERERKGAREKGREEKRSSSNKARGDIGDPRIHQGAQTAWSLFQGALIYDRPTNRLASSER